MLFAKKVDAITEFTAQTPILLKRAREQNMGLSIMKWADHGFGCTVTGCSSARRPFGPNPRWSEGLCRRV
jgi:hypothetical protein